ncbi:hypothetical protein VNO78_03618 [Psophocarpus tetragonolobus]|uniref:Uncharacterized protein n=1 Tax=Psophocarpus tetragonolobus TaxID=3891 RepID=A0AAN9XX41_PSOTE
MQNSISIYKANVFLVPVTSTNGTGIGGSPQLLGTLPEEEYYNSHGVRNINSHFETPNGKIFTHSFLPSTTSPWPATVLLAGSFKKSASTSPVGATSSSAPTSWGVGTPTGSAATLMTWTKSPPPLSCSYSMSGAATPTKAFLHSYLASQWAMQKGTPNVNNGGTLKIEDF